MATHDNGAYDKLAAALDQAVEAAAFVRGNEYPVSQIDHCFVIDENAWIELVQAAQEVVNAR